MRYLAIFVALSIVNLSIDNEFDPTTYQPTALPKGRLIDVKKTKFWAFPVGQETTKLLKVDYDLVSYKLELEAIKERSNLLEQKITLLQQIQNKNSDIIKEHLDYSNKLRKDLDEYMKNYYIEKNRPRIELGHPVHFVIELFLTGIVLGLVVDKVF